MKNTKQNFILIILTLLFFNVFQLIFSQERTEVNIPDIPGFYTLKADLHMHTVFSDGEVWPTVRVEEAWRDGLDIIAITDHLEYQPHKDDLPTNHNRSFELALPLAKSMGIILIKGAEITRSMPPGHFNAIFLEDVELLDTETWEEAFLAATKQNAFIIWNHPGWTQPNEIPIWYDEHSDIFQKAWMNGIEIVNEFSYYPLAYQWAIDSNLTILGNSDIHPPVYHYYNFENKEHRAITLIFAKQKTKSSVREALFNRQTAVYYKNRIIGNEKFLKPLFYESVNIVSQNPVFQDNNKINIRIHNYSDIDYLLNADTSFKDFNLPVKLKLPAHKTVLLKLKSNKELNHGKNNINIPYFVSNLEIAPGKALAINLEFEAYSMSGIKILPDDIISDLYKIQTPENSEFDLFYTLDDSDPSQLSLNSSKTFESKEPINLKIAAYIGDEQIGEIMEKDFSPNLAIGKSLELKNDYSSSYTGGGKNAIIDGVTASIDYKDGKWQAYRFDDLEAVIDLGKVQKIKSVSISFLENNYSWIFLPEEVKISVSKSGKKYEEVFSESFTADPNIRESRIAKVFAGLKDINARYIKVYAKNIGLCPEWHSGAGKKAWLFVDEIIVK
ncbi:MAG: discoidin domain-containing protein [Bacteroidales bacterium]|nr:discoidin domain-containing protein [Bacteroidales bacterium]